MRKTKRKKFMRVRIGKILVAILQHTSAIRPRIISAHLNCTFNNNFLQQKKINIAIYCFDLTQQLIEITMIQKHLRRSGYRKWQKNRHIVLPRIRQITYPSQKPWYEPAPIRFFILFHREIIA